MGAVAWAAVAAVAWATVVWAAVARAARIPRHCLGRRTRAAPPVSVQRACLGSRVQAGSRDLRLCISLICCLIGHIRCISG